MYKIEKTSYGFKLTFGDSINVAEMTNWVKEAEKALVGVNGKFGVFIDMRTLKPLDTSAQKEMEKGQKLFKGKGMERSAVVLNSPITTLQFKRIAQETGIYQWERYFDASKTANFEKSAIDWIKNAIDPDKKN